MDEINKDNIIKKLLEDNMYLYAALRLVRDAYMQFEIDLENEFEGSFSFFASRVNTILEEFKDAFELEKYENEH